MSEWTPVNGNRLALDTNVAIAVLNQSNGAGHWLRGADYIILILPVPVVGELRFGALNLRQSQDNLLRVDALVTRSQVIHIDIQTAGIYSEVRLRLKRIGKPIPENDIWIASLCIQHGLPLATTDSHFAAVEGLQLKTR